MSNEFLHFDSYACRYHTNQIFRYCNWVEERLFPSFGDWDEEVEREYNRLLNAPTFDPDIDPASASEEAIEFGLGLAEINSYMLGMAIVGLYHLWEKTTIRFLTREICHFMLKAEPSFRNYDSIKKAFFEYSTDIEKLPCSPNLSELRLVANAIKHGKGSSYNGLKHSQSDILTLPPPNSSDAQITMHGGHYTLLGIDIHPTPTHFQRYKQAVLDFWDYKYWQKIGEWRYPQSTDNGKLPF